MRRQIFSRNGYPHAERHLFRNRPPRENKNRSDPIPQASRGFLPVRDARRIVVDSGGVVFADHLPENSMIRFAHSEYLYAIALLPVLVLVFLGALRPRRKARDRVEVFAMREADH